MSWKIDERVDMIAVHVINLHVDAVLGRIFRKVGRELCCCRPVEQRPPFQCGLNHMQPRARVGVERHGRDYFPTGMEGKGKKPLKRLRRRAGESVTPS